MMPNFTNNLNHDADSKNDKPAFRILVVDDEKDILEVIRIYLQKWGFVVHAYSDPVMALEHFAASNPDKYHLLLTDVRMPGMTGIELAQKIIELKPDIRVVLMTAFELDSAAISTALDAPLKMIRREDVIRKPFRLVEICDAVKKQLKV